MLANTLQADHLGDGPYLVVLGIAQDAGYPQAGCAADCCARAWREPRRRRLVACIAIVEPSSGKRWLIDCTPDFREQLRHLDEIAPRSDRPGIDGIFLTHAHFGHYGGLAQLGRETIGAQGIPVYAMPRMRAFIETNAPWDQLVGIGNIELCTLADGVTRQLSTGSSVTPFIVPHRGEYSETVGFRIGGPTRSAIYIPDIDNWDDSIEDAIVGADVAYLDGTAYSRGEMKLRDEAEIPHPFIEDSILRFADLPDAERGKIRFLHLNHTNPALDPSSEASRTIARAGHHVAHQGETFEL